MVTTDTTVCSWTEETKKARFIARLPFCRKFAWREMFRTGNRWARGKQRCAAELLPRGASPTPYPPPCRPFPPTQPRVTGADYSITRCVNTEGTSGRRGYPQSGASCLRSLRWASTVCSENALLFHRDKKFNVWIITSELIDRQRGPVGEIAPGEFPLGYWLT